MKPIRQRWIRHLMSASLALAITAMVAGEVLADAGNPILGTITGTVVPDQTGPGATVYVRGQWNWLSHNSDCNFDRAATGVGIIWNDPNGADGTRTIGTATRSGTTVTITLTTQQTTFSVGDHVTVSGITGGTGFNGDFVLTGVASTSLKYTSAGTGSGSGGTVTDDDVFNGFKVQKSPITGFVGTQTAAGGNPVDQMVHPVDRGNQVEGYITGTWTSTTQGYTTNTPGDYPQGQAFVDPSPPNPNSYASWRGGCGREPLTATASKDGNPESTGNSCGTTPGSTTCSGHPWGSWGYEVNGGLGYSHHFANRSDLTVVCANFYDVHGGGKFPGPPNGNFQRVNGAKEITVNGNSDNSIQTNAFDTAQGANCFSFAVTETKTQPSIVPNDTANVKGNNPTGSMTFDLFPPSDATCAGTPSFTQTVPLTNGSATTSNSTFVASTLGTWRWRLTYNGDTNNPRKTSACGFENFTITNSKP